MSDEAVDLKELKLRILRLEEENNRFRVITGENQTHLQFLKTLVDHFAQQALNLHGTEEGVKEEVQRIKRIIDGDPSLDLAGIRQDVREIKELLNDPRLDIRELRGDLQRISEQLDGLTRERDAVYNQIKGARWLAGAAGLTTIVNLLGFANGWFGG